MGAIEIPDRVIERLRATFPKARILVRLDGGFGGPELLNFLEDESKVEYIGVARIVRTDFRVR